MTRHALLPAVIATTLVAACQAADQGRPEDSTTDQAPHTIAAPTLAELRQATYEGFDRSVGVVTLEDGRWQGEPLAPGSAARPSVELLGDLRVVGDLDGDGVQEAAVFLAVWTGGTGTFHYIAVVGRKEGALENRTTALLGDRVQVRGARVEEARLLVDVVRGGPEDAACCPGELATLGFTLTAGGLEPVDVGVAPSRLSLAALAGTEWVLRSWSREETAPAEPEVTLRYDEGRFAGRSGCNRYFAPVNEADGGPGSLKVGLGAGTRMACPDPAGAIEMRFLRQLEGVNGFGFVAGRLSLTWESGDEASAMLFDGREPAE
jgi:heat shock protein HslJ